VCFESMACWHGEMHGVVRCQILLHSGNPRGIPCPCRHCHFAGPIPSMFQKKSCTTFSRSWDNSFSSSLLSPLSPMLVSSTFGYVVTGSRVISNCRSMLLYLCLWFVMFCLSSGVIDCIATTCCDMSMSSNTTVISLREN